MHLIVVDDEPAIGAFVSRVGIRAGWTVESTCWGADFQQALKNKEPDLVILDLLLGVSDGVEQLRFLDSIHYRGPIVLLSGVNSRILEAANQLGTDLNLQIVAAWNKPIPIGTLREMFRKIERLQGERRPELRAVPLRPDHGLTVADVTRAIRQGEMRLHLQPVLSAATGVISSFEALIRWEHTALGMIIPDDFIGLAERDDEVIDELTMWVAATAIDLYERLAAIDAPRPIAINISSANLFRLNFCDRLSDLVAKRNVPTAALVLEMTETAAMRDPRATIDILTRLRLKGFQIALDDFGTGYSSLKTLLRMPFSVLKIDKSFVFSLLSSRDCWIITRAITNLARDLAIDSVAEGVETREVATVLTEFGVTSLQGYLFSRPLPIEGVIEVLRKRQI